MRNPIFRIGFSPTMLLAVASVVKCILVLTHTHTHVHGHTEVVLWLWWCFFERTSHCREDILATLSRARCGPD